MPLTPSPACLAGIAENCTPLRRRFGCSDPSRDRPRSLKPRLDDWVVDGRTPATLADVLRVTPALALRLLSGWPAVVVAETVTDLRPAIDEVVALGDRLPRVIVLPNERFVGEFSSHFAQCDSLGIVLVRLRDVERLAARLPR